MSSHTESTSIPDVARIDVNVHRSWVATIGERVRGLLEQKGTGFNELDRAIGQGSGYTTRLVAGKKKRPDPAILHKIAEVLGVGYEWLVTGKGEPGGSPVEPTPPTPPTGSGPRVKLPGDRGDHWFPDWIEDLFNALLQSLGKVLYTPEQVRAAKVFIRDATAKYEESGTPRMALGALEAARELDEAGKSPVPPAIFALLVEKNAPASEAERQRREEGKEFVKEMQEKARKDNLRHGIKPKSQRQKAP